MPHKTVSLVLLLVFGVYHSVLHAQDSTKSPSTRWEKTIQAFEKSDAENPPAAGQILFIGSSSIRLWNLEKWLPDTKAINRGFGGSEIADSAYFFDRIVTPYKPRVIVMYAGDNDIAHGKQPCEVHRDFQQFTAKLHKTLPDVPLVYIAIKPSLSRWKLVHRMRAANALINVDCSEDPLLTFLDVDTPMIGADGLPRPELFAKDGLHLSDEGYKLWTDLLRPYIE